MKIEISGFPGCTDTSADNAMRDSCAAIQDAFATLTNLIDERDGTIRELESTIDERDERIAELEKDLADALEGKEA